MKAAHSIEVSNKRLVDLFARLNKREIHTKGYFIMGGPKETRASSRETVEFAVNSGLSLAYFALYKEFVPATSALTCDQPPGGDNHEAYSRYSELNVNWDALFLDALKNIENEDTVANINKALLGSRVGSVTKPMLEIYDDLSRLGFSFSDLVKYNDYHDDSGPSRKVLNRVNFGDQSEYTQAVAEAYINFYLRPKFLSTYKKLIDAGY